LYSCPYPRPVAQLAEWRSPKPQVGGSIPSWPAISLENRKQMQIKNIFLWALISLLSLGTLIMQFYVNLSSSIHNTVWGLWLFLSMGIFLLTEKGIAFKVFAKDSINEVKKVVWPTKQETIQTTMIVIIMVAVTGVILWMLDNLMIWLIARLAHLA